MHVRLFHSRRIRSAPAVAATTIAAIVAVGASAHAQDTGALRNQIDSAGAREQRLSSDADRLGALEARAQKAVSLMQGRLDDTQASLARAQARQAGTEARLRTQRMRLQRLQRTLERDRGVLAASLRSRYMAATPDLVGVVLDSHDFSDLIERMSFLDLVQRRNTSILTTVRSARGDAQRQSAMLARLVPEQRAETAAVQRQRDALATMSTGLERRRDALAEARAARLQALSTTRANRAKAQKTLKKLEAEQEQAKVSQTGPGGPWAIPWAIVECESGGQNLPPNAATASGYYQFISSTWRALGGSTPAAYLASKAEQDRLAAKLWAGGSGARNWDCATIVGYR